eukprot:4691097-Ditylum_brightwellii.AAC.1
MLYNMRYEMTTVFGISAFENWHNLRAAVFGIKYGATDGPLEWTFINNVVLNCFQQLVTGYLITALSRLLQIANHRDMFVDDNTMINNNPNPAILPTALMQQIEHDSTLRGRLLWANEGLFEFSKSTYFLAI